MTPSDEQELWLALNTAQYINGPVAIRYPRGFGACQEIDKSTALCEIGKGKVLRSGNSKMALLNFGPLLPQAMENAQRFDLTLVDMRFGKAA